MLKKSLINSKILRNPVNKAEDVYLYLVTFIMSDTLKCAVIWYTQSWGGVPAAHCTTSYSPELRSVCGIIGLSTIYKISRNFSVLF